MQEKESRRKSHSGDNGSADTDKDKHHRDKARNRARFSQGQAGMPPFSNTQFMQMRPLLMAMGNGGSFPGAGMAGTQIQLLMWMIETWLDYLASLQEVLERALERLQEMNLCGGGMADDGEHADQDGKEW